MTGNGRRVAVCLAVALCAGVALAQPEVALTPPVSSDPAPKAQPWLLRGRCELSLDPATGDGRRLIGPIACIRASLGAEVTFVSGTPDENTWVRYAHLYGGLLPTRWLALQARGRARHTLPLGDLPVENKDVVTDYAVLQLGNPALHTLRFTAGKVRLPFGIDRSEATEHYQTFDDRRFWESPEHGAYITMDDRRSMQAELGYGTNALADRTPPGEVAAADPDAPGAAAPGELPLEQAMSLRLMGDFAALDGSRLVLSGYGEKDGTRRIGAGFVAVSRKEDLTLFEFVRRLATVDGRAEPFAQLLRVGYVGAWRGDNRWIVQFDDERLRFRRGHLGHDAKLFGHAILRFGVAYHKSETGDGRRRWYVTSGLEARL